MLARVRGGEAGDGFGRRLSLATLAADEDTQRARLRDWERAHKLDVARIRAVLAALAP